MPFEITDCSADEFECQDGTCIELDQKCDSREDCPNGEDEKGCEDEDLLGNEIAIDLSVLFKIDFTIYYYRYLVPPFNDRFAHVLYQLLPPG